MTSGRRPYLWKIEPIRLGVTVVAVPLLVPAVVIVVVSGLVAEPVGNLRGAGATTVTWWNILKWPVLLVVLSICWRSSTGPARTPSREVSSGVEL